MRGPFPGMDPYLEAPDVWPALHSTLVTCITADLQPQLVPRYLARPGVRVTLGPLDEPRIPDVTMRERDDLPRAASRTAVAVRPSPVQAAVPEIIQVPELITPHRFVTIRDAKSREVITVIEILSPWNKRGKGLREYQDKQDEYLLSEVNLVEIDLLRGGQHTIAVPKERMPPFQYCTCVHRAESKSFEVIRFGVRDALPNVGLPLRYDDPDVILHLGEVFSRCYEEGAYDLDTDYSRQPEPPLSLDDAAWAQEQIRQWREAEAGKGR
jgi:hypothetical protein